MAEIGNKFGLGGGGGIHFKDPWQMYPYIGTATQMHVHDSGGTKQSSATTAYFTEAARRGLQDTTNWTADTYKTLLNVSSGKGFVGAIIGPTAGGAETTTFELTIDGALTTIAVGTLASGERASLATAWIEETEYTTASIIINPAQEELEADKATLNIPNIVATCLPPWHAMRGIPMLQFKQSLLIRAKHSASITNSTATAYSAVMYRLGL